MNTCFNKKYLLMLFCLLFLFENSFAQDSLDYKHSLEIGGMYNFLTLQKDNLAAPHYYSIEGANLFLEYKLKGKKWNHQFFAQSIFPVGNGNNATLKVKNDYFNYTAEMKSLLLYYSMNRRVLLKNKYLYLGFGVSSFLMQKDYSHISTSWDMYYNLIPTIEYKKLVTPKTEVSIYVALSTIGIGFRPPYELEGDEKTEYNAHHFSYFLHPFNFSQTLVRLSLRQDISKHFAIGIQVPFYKISFEEPKESRLLHYQPTLSLQTKF